MTCLCREKRLQGARLPRQAATASASSKDAKGFLFCRVIKTRRYMAGAGDKWAQDIAGNLIFEKKKCVYHRCWNDTQE